MDDSNVDQMFDRRSEGISGSKFTIAFVLLLIAGVVFGFVGVIRFQKTMTAFDEVRLKWPAAAAAFDEQIQSINALVMKANPPLENSEVVAWNQAVRDFREYSQYDRQVLKLGGVLNTGNAIRSQIIENSELSGSKLSFPERTIAIEDFIQADEHLEKLQIDWIGRLCQTFFGLNLSMRVFERL